MECRNICPICLRTNRKLNVISTVLSQYHSELAKYSLQCNYLRYCSDCEWLLRKTYNFQKKCSNAAKILNDWMNAVMDKTPATLLHLNLPPMNLGLWTSKNNKVFDYTHVDEATTQKEDNGSKMIGNVKEFQMNEVSNSSCQNIVKSEEVLDYKTDNTGDNNLDLICLSNDDDKNDVIVIVDDDEHPDDASLNSNDDCDDYLNPASVETNTERQTLDELANISLTDEDLDDDYSNSKTTNSSDKEEKWASTKRTIMSKLESIDNSLNSICNNWEVASLLTEVRARHLNDQTKDNMKQEIQKFVTEKMLFKSRWVKNVKSIAKIEHLKSRLDWINEQSAYAVNYYQMKPKERLKAMLNTWGELRTTEGFVFNKDVIINCLDKAPERLITHLLKSMRGKKRLSPGAARTLQMIEKHPNTKLAKYESVFDIEFLQTEMDKLEEFQRRKTYDCYVNATFKCEICYQGFKNKGLLEYHTNKRHHESQGQFVCHICHVRVPQRKLARLHMSSHTAVFKCKLCPLVTHYRDSMMNHYEQHQGTKYRCGKCDKIFKSRSMYMTHQSTDHPSSDSVCTTCGKGFVSRKGLHGHIQKKHGGAAPVPAGGASYSCSECTLCFLSEAACARHRRKAHGARDIECVKLGARRLVLPRRKLVITCPEPECGAAGGGYGWVVKHYRAEHPAVDVKQIYAHRQRYLCHICGKIFNYISYLREHLNYHAGITLPCPLCDRQLASKLKLRQHQMRHYPPRYCCDQCGKKFHSSSNLFNHRQSHTGDRRYKCHICSKGFLHKNTLDEHIRGVHHEIRRRRVHKRRGERKLSTNNLDGDTRRPRLIRTSDGVAHTSGGVTDASNDPSDTDKSDF